MTKRSLGFINRKGREKDCLMMSGRRDWRGLILLMIVALLLAGCPKRPDVQVGVAESIGPETATAAKTTAKEEKVAEPIIETATIPVPESPPLKDVFFNSDKAVLGEDAKKRLDEIIEWLNVNPEAHIVIEGHTDERGPEAYNLILGKQRANVVRDYLVAGGIDAKRLHTTSQGEKQPFVQGHDDSAWMRNRRVHFVLASEVRASLNSEEEKTEEASLSNEEENTARAKSPASSPGLPVTPTSPVTLGP
jgi:peptidoglycan-associated lipoprotein